MSMTDPIADMLTRIRNGQQAKKVAVSMGASKAKKAIAEVLKAEGFIEGYNVVDGSQTEDGHPQLNVDLKYFKGRPVITKIKRESSPGLRVYRSADELPTVIAGMGIAIISTSKGLMTDSQARAANQGGEVLCTVY